MSGACLPPGAGAIITRLSRGELEDLAARFWGRCPERFEELLLRLQAARDRQAARAGAT
jgi:hypothetical protein